MYNYIVFTFNKYNKNIECEYISFRDAVKLLNKYKVYIFKYKKDEDILYLEYPFDCFYSTNKINLIEKNNEEDIISFNYIEIRFTDLIPIARMAVNMDGL